MWKSFLLKMELNEYLKEIIAGDSEIRSVFEWGHILRKEGKSPINLSIGNPDIKPPAEYYTSLEKIIDELKKADTNKHGYMPNSGYVETRQRIASDLFHLLNVKFKTENVFMTAGAANGLDIILKTLIEPITHKCASLVKKKEKSMNDENYKPDEVITIAPYFVEYKNYIKGNQGKQIVASSDDNFDLDLREIESSITPNTRAIILNSPNNPTGAIYGTIKLQQLSEILRKKNQEYGISIAVIEDAPYGQIVFGNNKLNSILSYYNYTFFVYSFSKSLGLAGERIGFFAVHPDIEDKKGEWQLLKDALTINLRVRVVNAPALQQKIIEKIGMTCLVDVKQYERRIGILVKTIEKLGFTIVRPKGGFYLFTEIPSIFKDEYEFRQAAQKGNEPLLYIPGTAFGGKKYERFIRLSACAPHEEIQRACNKLNEICLSKKKS